MLILTGDEVRQALPMREIIEAMKRAYASLSNGKADAPLRTRLPIPPHNGLALFMPAYVLTDETEALAVKIVSIHPENPKHGLPYIHAAVVVIEASTGRAVALLEGGTLTAIRTGAGSGAAMDILARKDSKTVAIFGAGVQGRTQLEAACTVRDIESVWVYDANRESAEKFAVEMAGHGYVPRNLRVAASPAQAAKDADIICTATTSTNPVFADADVKPGAHISAIGSYTLEMQEVPAETVARAKVVVDSRSATLAETGDLLKPMRDGMFDESHIHGELGEIVLGRKTGRTSESEITYFKSVGIAVQDAMAAQLALLNAEKMGLGQKVNF